MSQQGKHCIFLFTCQPLGPVQVSISIFHFNQNHQYCNKVCHKKIVTGGTSGTALVKQDGHYAQWKLW